MCFQDRMTSSGQCKGPSCITAKIYKKPIRGLKIITYDIPLQASSFFTLYQG